MRHPSARSDGRGDLKAAGLHWLLIGNSRWHWAVRQGNRPLQGWSESLEAGAARLQALAPDQLVAWAAVGRVPEPLLMQWLALRRVTAAHVPLVDAPPWLGVDRALAGWGAWHQSGGSPVLVADAGTALSLTRVDGGGRFAGGRLLAGAGLQLRALGQSTVALPALSPGALVEGLAGGDWPAATEQAIAVGVVRGLVAALLMAACELEQLGQRPPMLWLTGGDGPLLAPLLQQGSKPWRLAPDLVLDALVALRPGPDP